MLRSGQSIGNDYFIAQYQNGASLSINVSATINFSASLALHVYILKIELGNKLNINFAFKTKGSVLKTEVFGVKTAFIKERKEETLNSTQEIREFLDNYRTEYLKKIKYHTKTISKNVSAATEKKIVHEESVSTGEEVTEVVKNSTQYKKEYITTITESSYVAENWTEKNTKEKKINANYKSDKGDKSVITCRGTITEVSDSLMEKNGTKILSGKMIFLG